MIVYLDDEPMRAVLDMWDKIVYLRPVRKPENYIVFPFDMFGPNVSEHGELDMNFFHRVLKGQGA